MARSTFSFTKRQKELDRKKKQEEKRRRKLDKKGAMTETEADLPSALSEQEDSKPVS